MLALAIHYLNGWAMAASDGARKEQAEWPPHPDRVFMALAAAWFETGEDPAEGAALRWLESLPSPAIRASTFASRTLTTSYVPVNDARMGRKLPKSHDLAKLKAAGLSVLPDFRSRQPRSFPVAIPSDPIVHLIWTDQDPSPHRHALDSLAAKITHVGHSASLVQGWIEDTPPEPNLTPLMRPGARRLAVPRPGRLDGLALRLNRRASIQYADLVDAIARTKENIDALKPAPRTSWENFPDIPLLATESDTKKHPDYKAAKAGDPAAATRLVEDLLSEEALAHLTSFVDAFPDTANLALACAHAYERLGLNAIPAALAQVLRNRLGIPYEPGIVQVNVVYHTGADGYGRLARQARFFGTIDKSRDYLLVDDFVGQGGTLANLRGQIMVKGKARVLGAICLSGKPYSAKLALQQEQLDELRQKHGGTLEKWWKAQFGHAFDCLTQSEARYLARSPDAEQIRDRIAAAKREGGGPGSSGNHRQEKARLKKLESQLSEQFPNGRPLSQWPLRTHWDGYSPVAQETTATPPASAFDPNLIVLALSGRRLPLPATLKLTTALRGSLMKGCPASPQPEWFSGHQANGKPSKHPHMALFPLAFVDAEHADGHVMGMAIALPKELDPIEAGACLETYLLDPDTGLARPHRLFDGPWLECGIEMDLRSQPPKNLSAATWMRPSRLWASVTPVVLDRHFKKNRWNEAAESIKNACVRIGLPRPEEVNLNPVSRVRGAPHAREFPAIKRKSDSGCRYHTHVTLRFSEPVAGPVLIGAGRFRGYGLCRPLRDNEPRQSREAAPEKNHD